MAEAGADGEGHDLPGRSRTLLHTSTVQDEWHAVVSFVTRELEDWTRRRIDS